MRALLLAAGLGTRLRPITDTIPKSLVPIHGIPLLDIWLARVFHAGIERVVINLHYLPEQVRACVANSPWRDRIDLFDEPVLLGTGGTLAATRRLLGRGSVLVVHADNLSEIDLNAFQSAHQERPANCAMTMALFETDAPQTCGIVEQDEERRIVAMHEKVANPPGTLANAAVYIVEPEVIEMAVALTTPQIDISTQLIPALLGRIYSHEIIGYHRDIGTPQALAAAHSDIGPDRLASLMEPRHEV